MTAEIPRVQFEATLDELVDVNSRLADRSSVARSWRRRSIASVSVAVGAGTFLVLGVFSPEAPIVRFAATAMAGCAAWFLCGPMYDRALKARVRRYLAEQFGHDTTVPCTIELRAAGLWIRQKEIEMSFDWQAAESVDERAGDVEVVFRQGLVVVRGRAFQSVADREHFIDVARSLMSSGGKGR